MTLSRQQRHHLAACARYNAGKNKPPRFTKKQTNAHAAAMSAARQHGFAEVFALVPVGKAVRGAEWVAK